MKRIQLNHTDLTVSRLCLGGNVFGWSADEAQSHVVLSEYVELAATLLTPQTCIASGATVTSAVSPSR